MMRKCATKSRLCRSAWRPARSTMTSTTLSIICGGSAWTLRKRKNLAVVSFRGKDLRSKIQRASRKSMKSALARPRTGSASSAASAQWKDDSTNVTTPAPAKTTPIVALSFLVFEGNLVPVLLVSPDRDHSGACDCKQLAAVCAVTFGDICVLPHPARASVTNKMGVNGGRIGRSLAELLPRQYLYRRVRCETQSGHFIFDLTAKMKM